MSSQLNCTIKFFVLKLPHIHTLTQILNKNLKLMQNIFTNSIKDILLLNPYFSISILPHYYFYYYLEAHCAVILCYSQIVP